MSTTNLDFDALASALDRITGALDNSSTEVDEWGNTLSREQVRYKRQQDQLKQLAEQQIEQTKKQIQVVENLVGDFVSLNTALSQTPGSFGVLKSALNTTTNIVTSIADNFGILGKIVSSTVKVFNEIAKFTIEEFEKGYGVFEKLSNTGVIQRFEDLAEANKRLGLSYQDLSSLFEKSGTQLAAIGGSAVAGRQQFEKMGLATYHIREEFQKLGVSSLEFRESQLMYVTQQNQFFRGRLKDSVALGEAHKEYMLQLDALSKVTGLSKKQLQEQAEARRTDIRYRSFLRSLERLGEKGSKAANEIDNLISMVGVFGDESFSRGLMNLFSTSGIPGIGEMSLEVSMALGRMGIQGSKFINDMVHEGKSATKAFGELTEGTTEVNDQLMGRAGISAGLANIFGPDNPITRTYIATSNLELQKGKDLEQLRVEAARKREQITRETDTQNAQLAKVRISLYDAGRNIQLLATESRFATTAMAKMSEGIDYLTEKMYELSGKEVPEYIKTRKKERQAIEEETKERERISKKTEPLITAGQENIAKLENRLKGLDPNSRFFRTEEEALKSKIAQEKRMMAPLYASRARQQSSLEEKIKLRQSATEARQQAEIKEGLRPQSTSTTPGAATPVAPGTTQGTQGTKNPVSEKDLSSEGLRIKHGSAQKAGADLSPKIIDLAQKIQNFYGKQYPDLMFTGFNDGYNRGGNSAHDSGIALDFTLGSVDADGKPIAIKGDPKKGAEFIKELNKLGAHYALDEYNFPSASASGPHFHAEIKEFAKGGIVSGSQSGFPALLHGKEIVQPLTQDSVLERLAKTPSDEGTLNPIGALTQQYDNNFNLLKEIFGSLDSKMDSMVNLLSNANRYSRSIAQNLM